VAYHKDVRRAVRFATLVFFLTFFVLFGRDYGPAAGTKMPDFELQDQNGKPHSLDSLLGPQGAVILFYRSADW
jgi:cytochrome oxidase Cu insertion factor (SCO1/SenC/PrrC family)